MTACANHHEAKAVARCARCRTAFCDACIAYLVNDDPWCEPCGHAMIEAGKGRPALAVVVLVALLGTFGALMYFQLYVLGRFHFYTAALGLIPFGVAWRIAYPPTAGDRPTIVERSAETPRPPIRRGKRLD